MIRYMFAALLLSAAWLPVRALELPSPVMPKVAGAAPAAPAPALPTVKSDGDALAAAILKTTEIKERVPGGNAGLRISDEWLKILRRPVRGMAYVAPRRDVKIISEMQILRDETGRSRLRANLDFYKSAGYNAVLLTFDGNETPKQLLDVIAEARGRDLAVYAAFAGRESLDEPVFIEPERLQMLLTAVAGQSQGFLLGFRRTSAHMVQLPEAYDAWVVGVLRTANPQIEIWGELYFGRQLDDATRSWSRWRNEPSGCSGLLLANIGYERMRLDTVSEYFGLIAPAMVLICGQMPYYDSTNNTNKTFEQNLAVKHKLENRAMCDPQVVATLTYSDDGGDYIKNNLSR